MKKLIIPIILLLPIIAYAEITISVDEGIRGITSNSVIDIDHDSSSIWLGTGGGASASFDNGQTWITYGSPILPSDEVSALTANNRAIWVANSHSIAAAGETYPFGDGISVSRNGGLTWDTSMASQVRFYGKLSYDLSAYDSLAFSASFYGGLIRTLDFGATWQNLYCTQLDSINSDSVDYNVTVNQYQSLSNRYFAVKTDTMDFPRVLSVWAGSAKGIARFQFLADTLTGAFHTYPDSIKKIYFVLSDTTVDDSLKLPGNHVVALGVNKVDSVKYIWAACRPVSSGEQRRVAYTTDNGAIWHTVEIADPSGDDDVEAWDFSFARDTVYAATSFGLYKSSGDYLTWILLSEFRDPERQTFYQDNAPFYASDIVDGTLWAGGSEGVVKAVADGWDVFRSQREPDNHYAYPSPFSPDFSTRKGTTIHFKPASDTRATVKIYDFNLELVRTVKTDIPRLGGIESDDIVWDGTNDKQKVVANGVYFYRIQLDSGEDLWGKVVVIK